MANENSMRGAQLVQDHIEAGNLHEGRSSVPVQLHTLVIRKPGRVDSAMEFLKLIIGARSFGAAGQGDLGRDGDNDVIGTPEPTKEFAAARAAAFRTLENYFAGNINDELVVHADFKIHGMEYAARFIGEFDGETGRVLDPKYAPQAIPDVAASAEPVRRPDRQERLKCPDLQHVNQDYAVLPPGLIPDDVVELEQHAQQHYLVRLHLRNGNKMIIDIRTGEIQG